MSKGKAFVVVGHSHWGKSYTLNALTRKYGGGWYKRSVTIKQEKIPVKKMSNDDKPAEDLMGFIREKVDSRAQAIIIPFCPNFFAGRREETEKILNALRTAYEVFFMILKKAQGDGDTREIQDDEVTELGHYGKVEIVSEKLDKDMRAERFRSFVEKFL